MVLLLLMRECAGAVLCVINATMSHSQARRGVLASERARDLRATKERKDSCEYAEDGESDDTSDPSVNLGECPLGVYAVGVIALESVWIGGR